MQDRAFVQIGKLVLKEMGNKEPYELFIQNMFPEKVNYKMIVAVFEVNTEDDQLNCAFKLFGETIIGCKLLTDILR